MKLPGLDRGSSDFKAYAPEVDPRAKFRDCKECHGCTSLVNNLSGMSQELKGRHLKPDQGLSRARVYRLVALQ